MRIADCRRAVLLLLLVLGLVLAGRASAQVKLRLGSDDVLESGLFTAANANAIVDGINAAATHALNTTVAPGTGGGGSGDMVLATVQTITGAKTFNSTKLLLAGSTSGTITLNATAIAGSNTLTLPAATDTLVGRNTTDTLTNKTLTSPVLTAPTLGAATATTVNKLTLTAPASGATLTIADGKTLTASNSLTLTATDNSTLAIGAGGTLGSAAYTASSAYATPASVRGSLRQAQFWDDFQRTDVSPIGTTAASGQTYIYLNYPTSSRPDLVSHELLFTQSARGVLTSDGVIVANGDTVTIGSKVYTARTTLTPTEGEVLIAGSADAFLLNLIRAINHTGTPNTDYKCAAANSQVSADAAVVNHIIAVTALTPGSTGFSIASTETSAHLSWQATTLGQNAYYLEVVPGSTIFNVGCRGKFLTGPGTHDGSGLAQGVIIVTDTANSYLPANFLHLRWLLNQIIIEGTSTGLPATSIGTMSVTLPIGEPADIGFVIDGNSLTVTAAGQTSTFYSSFFNETTWTTAIFEGIAHLPDDTNQWAFDAIWANDPSVSARVMQPYSPKLSQLALGALLTPLQINADMICNLGYRVSVGRETGSAGEQGGGIYFRQDDGGNTSSRNAQLTTDMYNWGEVDLLTATALNVDPTIPRWHHDILNNRTSIGHNAASAPAGTRTLNVEGSLRATGALYDSSDSAGTSGQFLQTTGTATKWAAATISLYEPSDETLDGGSFAPSTVLTTPVAANQVLIIHGSLRVGSSGNYKLDGPSGCTGGFVIQTNTGTARFALGDNIVSGGETEAIYSGVIVNGATPGNVRFYAFHGDSTGVIQQFSTMVVIPQ